MDLALVEKLMRLLENSTLSELDLTENGVRIRIAKQAAPEVSVAPAQSATPQSRGATPVVVPASASPTIRRIEASLPGTFYRAPGPGAKPFVEMGDRISDGRKLAIIEAMKMMNPVEADCAGTVVTIHKADAEAVEPGDLLFSIDTGPTA